MRLTTGKILWFSILVFCLVGLAGALYAGYVMRKLPWQKPVFDTIPPPNPRLSKNAILVFSKTNGFRHESIEAGIEALRKASRQKGWDFYATENGAIFDTKWLQSFKVVVFLSTTGDILTSDQQNAFQKFIENGGGYAGIHSASDTESDWAWYHRMLGVYFRDHTFLPVHTPLAEVITETNNHPATQYLPVRWNKKDEWYNFTENIRSKEDFEVLLSVNEKSYPAFFPKAMHGDHPISWTHKMGKGRMFYTALGHHADTFTNPTSMQHIVGGIQWAGGLE